MQILARRKGPDNGEGLQLFCRSDEFAKWFFHFVDGSGALSTELAFSIEMVSVGS